MPRLNGFSAELTTQVSEPPNPVGPLIYTTVCLIVQGRQARRVWSYQGTVCRALRSGLSDELTLAYKRQVRLEVLMGITLPYYLK